MTEDIRVLIIDVSKKYGGASVRALTLANHLKPWNVAIAGLRDGPVIEIAKQRNIPVHIVGSVRTNPLIPWRLKKVIREGGFQVIDTQNIPSKFWGSLTTHLTDVAFVSTLNSSYEDEFGTALRGKLYTWLDRWTNTNVDRYVAVSKAIRNSLAKAGIPESRIDLVTNVVDIDESSLNKDRNLVRRMIGIPEDAILCVSVGRLVWAKGYEDFIDAFAVVAERVSNAYAAIVGGGVLHSALLEKIKKAGLENRVKLLGHRDAQMTWSVMKASDVFVLSSRSEGVPYALLEAAALQLPILSTRCGGIPEIFTDNQEALLVDVGDPASISAGLICLCEDRLLSQKLAANAKAKVSSEYNLSAQITAIRHAYRKALDNRQGKIHEDLSVALH